MANSISDIRSPQETQHLLTGERPIRSTVTQSDLKGIQATLTRLVDEGTDANHLAGLAVAIWRRIGAVLSSVFGHDGVSALFRRSLYLARANYPWLREVNPGATVASDFDSLLTVLAQREPSLALAANGWLLETFCELLDRLIGETLSQKLLQPVWLHPTIGTSAQDTHQ